MAYQPRQTRSMTKKQLQMKAVCSPHRYNFVFNASQTATTIRGKKLQALEHHMLYYIHL